MASEKYTEIGLGAYHPLVSFSYFFCVIGLSLLFIHPVYAALSALCAAIHALQLGGKRALAVIVFIALPIFASFSIANLLFNHHGSTYLFYWNYNPITLEALAYGLVSGAMTAAVTLWFFCYNEVVTSDKFLYLFGKLLPTAALIASMTLRTIPRMIGQVQVIAASQRALGMDWSQGGALRRAKSGARILSILVTWSLEDAVCTADSMCARGYGMCRRTNFSIFRMARRDLGAISVTGLLGLAGICAYALNISKVLFYPAFSGLRFDCQALISYAAFLMLGLMPVFITAREEAYWKSFQ